MSDDDSDGDNDDHYHDDGHHNDDDEADDDRADDDGDDDAEADDVKDEGVGPDVLLFARRALTSTAGPRHKVHMLGSGGDRSCWQSQIK